jgi:hypothetical protein
MPRGDGTGPRGFGPMTGSAAGFCVGFGVPGYTNFAAGRGCQAWGRGRGGGGRGFRNWYYKTGLTGWQRATGDMPAWGNPYTYGGAYNPPAPMAMTGEQKLDALRAQTEYLEDALEAVQKRLRELEGETPKTGPQAG